MTKKKKKKGSAAKVSPEVSGQRFLTGCVLPVFLFFCLFLILLYAASWCIWLARYPASFPAAFYYPVHQLRVWSRHIYELSEKGYALAGGTADPFLRGNVYSVFRAKARSGDHWVIHDDYAEVVYPETARQMVPYSGTRENFLKRFRIDGDYPEMYQYPAVVTYRAGQPVRFRCAPLEGEERFMFDGVCRVDRRDGILKPFAGWIPDREKELCRLYLAGVQIQENVILPAAYHRGDSAFRDMKNEWLPLLKYEFTCDQKTLREQILAGADLKKICQWRRQAYLNSTGAMLFPDILIRMAVRKSDLELMSALLRKKESFGELLENRDRGGFTALHEAAMQSEPKVLAGIIPFYPEVNIIERRTGATPFLAAVMAGKPDNVLLFLRRKDKKVNTALFDGSTALHLAVEVLSPEIVSMLLNHGASAGQKNKAGETPLQLLRAKIKAEHLENDDSAMEILRLLE